MDDNLYDEFGNYIGPELEDKVNKKKNILFIFILSMIN